MDNLVREGMEKIIPPTRCPKCNSELQWKNHLLYCVNFICMGRTLKRLEHFTKTLKIKGLGPKRLELLDISYPFELYNLSADQLIDILKSEKVAIKVLSEIEDSKKLGLNEVLPAFSIPLMGQSASNKICKKVSNIKEISQETCSEASLGPKVTFNLLEWLKTEEYKLYPFSFKVTKKVVSEKKGDKEGTVCITGKLTSYRTKAEAKSALETLGYTVKDNLTKDVTILVNESGIESSKTKKASDSGIQIITNINDLFGEN